MPYTRKHPVYVLRTCDGTSGVFSTIRKAHQWIEKYVRECGGDFYIPFARFARILNLKHFYSLQNDDKYGPLSHGMILEVEAFHMDSEFSA